MLTRNSDTVKQVGKGLESVPNKRLVLTWGNVADAADATSIRALPLISRLLARWCA